MNLFRPIVTKSVYTDIFRIYGVLTVLAGIGCCSLALTANLGSHGISDLKPLLIPGSLIVFIGIGTVFLLRVFVIILSTIFAAVGLCLIIGSILYVPFPFLILNVFFAFLAIVPIYCVVRSWKYDETEQDAAANP